MAMRAAAAFVFTAVLAVAAVGIVEACGDKFIRIGREIRFGRYVAIHPARILVYGPARSAPSRLPELPELLTRAGHTAVVVSKLEELGPALRSGRFDLVLTGLNDAGDVARQTRDVPARPDVMPVLIEARPSETAAAKALSPCMINVPSAHKNDALAEIDHRMELRLKAQAPGRRGGGQP
jgi:hypothetical protein